MCNLGMYSKLLINMRILNIFDENIVIASITQIDDSFFLSARSSREWSEMKRLMDKCNKQDSSSLEEVAKLIHDYNFNTELIEK